MRRLLVPIACLASVGLGLGACGDDGPSIDPEADEERIEDALLTVEDLPDGFTEGETSPNEDDENQCNEDVLDVDEDELEENEVARTDEVQFRGETTDVRAEITAFRDTELPERVLDGLGDDEYLECLSENFAGELPEGAELEDIEEIDSLVAGGRSVQVTILFTQGDEQFEVISQQHAVLVDRFGVSLTVTEEGGEPDPDVAEGALDAMVDRLEDED